MRDDQRFEIQSAFDLLPHVVGCSWATIWFRVNKIKNPTREEFREKVVEYFKILEPLLEVYPKSENFKEIVGYINNRNACLLYTSPSPRDLSTSRMPSSA